MSKNDNITDKKYLKIILILLCGAVGVLLLLGGDGLFGSSEAAEAVEQNSFPSADDYEKQIEEKVVRLCSSVKGVGSVSAVVTLGGGYSAVYAQDSQSSNGGYRNEFVIVGGTKGEALLVGYKQPEIAGVGIICTGGSSENIRCELVSLVSAALGISPSKIYVAEAKN